MVLKKDFNYTDYKTKMKKLEKDLDFIILDEQIENTSGKICLYNDKKSYLFLKTFMTIDKNKLDDYQNKKNDSVSLRLSLLDELKDKYNVKFILVYILYGGYAKLFSININDFYNSGLTTEFQQVKEKLIEISNMKFISSFDDYDMIPVVDYDALYFYDSGIEEYKVIDYLNKKSGSEFSERGVIAQVKFKNNGNGIKIGRDIIIKPEIQELIDKGFTKKMYVLHQNYINIYKKNGRQTFSITTRTLKRLQQEKKDILLYYIKKNGLNLYYVPTEIWLNSTITHPYSTETENDLEISFLDEYMIYTNDEDVKFYIEKIKRIKEEKKKQKSIFDY